MHLAVHNIKQREEESTRAFVTRYTDDTLQILGLHEEQRISGFVHGLKTRSLVEFLSTYLPTTYKGLMEKNYTWIEAKGLLPMGPQMTTERDLIDSRKAERNSSNREDHGHDTNQCRELRHQIKEAVKSEQLAHLVKGIKKGKTKVSDTQLGEWKKGDKDSAPSESLILMINREGYSSKRKAVEEPINGIGEITFPLFQASIIPLTQSS
ncbi:hypothetical protein Tco_1502191 [Tanacetum coccineum]